MNLVPDASLDSYRVADHKASPSSRRKGRHSFFVCSFFPPSIITRPRDRHRFCISLSLSLSVIDLSRIANGRTQSGSCSLGTDRGAPIHHCADFVRGRVISKCNFNENAFLPATPILLLVYDLAPPPLLLRQVRYAVVKILAHSCWGTLFDSK